jgi:hypothetical protein
LSLILEEIGVRRYPHEEHEEDVTATLRIRLVP